LTGGFTCLDVDAQVMGPDGSLYDVLFVGTKEGKKCQRNSLYRNRVLCFGEYH